MRDLFFILISLLYSQRQEEVGEEEADSDIKGKARTSLQQQQQQQQPPRQEQEDAELFCLPPSP